MDKKGYVSKDNIHQATDLIKIQNLMKNAERLGEETVVKKCKDRLKELTMASTSKTQPKTRLILNDAINEIDLEHWYHKNTYYGNKPLNKSMRTAQTNLSKNFGLEYDFETCDQLIQKIERNITNFNQKQNEKLAIETFDLIQLWGGGMGVKRFYYSGTRFQVAEWLPLYISSIEVMSDKNGENTKLVTEGLTQLLNIYGLGMSFATKHLRFWHELPIFDDRIGLLLYAKKAKKVEHYLQFISDLEGLADNSGLSITQVETSLFAFSQHFFANDKLNLIRGSSSDKDFRVAEIIAAS